MIAPLTPLSQISIVQRQLMPTIVYFNNCKGRRHSELFGTEAFFDLNAQGNQAMMAVGLPVGQRCVVASYGQQKAIQFDWHILRREVIRKDLDEKLVRVFFGEQVGTEAMTKAQVAKSARYRAFFDKNGNFRRPAVSHGDVPPRSIPTTASTGVTVLPDELPDGTTHFEGATKSIVVNAFERSAAARAECLEAFGTACAVCEMDFGATYGPLAEGYIHVHHLRPLSKIGKTYKVNGRKDLRPVCPNCHAVIHLGGKLRSVNTVKKLLRSAKEA